MDINELKAWGISQQIAKIVEDGFSYDEETGEILFTIDDLDALNEALDKKFESLAGIFQMYESKAEALKARSKEILEVSKQYDKKAEHIKNYIDELMTMNEKTKVEVGDKKISYRKSTSGNIVNSEDLMNYINSNGLGDRYLVYKDPTISKKNISDDIKATKQEDGSYSLNIPGFEIVENRNLIIK